MNLYLLGLGLGGLAWLSLHYLTGARWSESLKGIPRAMSMVLPVAAIGLLAVLLCRPSLYAWTSAGFTEEPASPLRHLWLNRPFFLLPGGDLSGAVGGLCCRFPESLAPG